ncbi:TPA: hypothetical protein G8M40_004483 [Salmonella enterica]|nr:hypothetical protein [Salmonella enterica subsp. enterica serovar Newport]HAF1392020.1 hypothetical protein [Salmonella enterica]HCL5312854.1 hypothetical protein [Salmonella enterica]
MSRVSYSTQGTVASVPQKPVKLPTIRDVMYSSIDEYEALLEEKPHFADGLTGLLSTLVAHECRTIGF